MTNRHFEKKSLIASILVLCLCLTSLIGTTFAWFTDTVTSENNVIKSGTLNIEMYYADGSKAVPADDSSDWKNAEGVKIYTENQLWEPGYTDAKHIKISNEGSLALKYQLAIIPVGEVSDLAEVIDVYLYEVADTDLNATQITDRTAIDEDMYVGTLAEVISKGIGQGKIDAYLDYTTTIVLKMREEAGNKYQDKSIGDGFTIQLLATQATVENDSFDDKYDADAWVNGMLVYNDTDLQAAISANESVKLMNDVDLTKAIEVPAPVANAFSMRAAAPAVVIDLNGNKLTSKSDDGYAIMNELGNNVVITDTVGGGEINGVVYNADGSKMTVECGTFNAVEGGAYVFLNSAGSLTINGGTINGGSSYPVYSYNADSDLIINDATVNATFGCINCYGTNSTAVINGGTFNMTGVVGRTSHIAYFSNVDATINGGSFNKVGDISMSATGGGGICAIYGAKLTINGGSVAGDYADIYNWGGNNANGRAVEITVNGGTYKFDPKAYVADGFASISNNDGTYVVLSDEYASCVAPGVYLSEDGTVYGVFTTAAWQWVSDQADSYFSTGKQKTIKLEADLDFGGAAAGHIRFWNWGEGAVIVDGNGHTLSNLVVAANGDVGGLFSGTLTIKNLTVDNATATGKYVGILSGNMYGNIENCTVKNSTVNGTYWQTGALAGQYNSGNVIGCTVENCTINGLSAVGGFVGIVNENGGVRKIENCTLKNNVINQTGSFGADYDKLFGVAIGYINIANSTVIVNGCTVEGNTLRGEFSNRLYGEAGNGTRVIVNGATYVTTTDELIAAIKNAPVGEETVILMADGTYAGDINITVAALGASGGDVVIKADAGAKPVITGNVTLGYRDQGVGATMYDANVTFDGITFDQAAAEQHSITVMDVKSLTLKNCTIISDGEYGLTCARGNGTGTSKIVGCTFESAGIQLLGNFATGLVIDDCTFNESRINVQAGNGVTVQNCEFNNTLTSANVGDSFYAIRSNSTPVTVKDCKINIDSELTEIAAGQAKWYLLANRGSTNWTVENVAVTLTEAALAQTELVITACTSTGLINVTNLTVNGAAQ